MQQNLKGFQRIPGLFFQFFFLRLAVQVVQRSERLALTHPSDVTQFSVTFLSVQNRSSNFSQVQVALGFLMKDTPRHVLFRARVRIPAQLPSSGLLHIGSISSWCLASAGDISVQIPLAIRLSPSADWVCSTAVCCGRDCWFLIKQNCFYVSSNKFCSVLTPES